MKRRAIAAIALSIIMLFSFSACGGGDALATIGGAKVTQKQVDSYAAFIAAMSYASYSELDDSTKAYLDNSILLWLTDQACIKDYLKKEGVDVITKDIEKELETSTDSMLQSVKDMVGENEMKKYGMDKDLIRQYLEAQYYDDAYRKAVLEKDPVTDEEVQKYYDEHKDAYVRTSKAVDTSHVLIGDENHTPEDLALANEIRERAAAGEDFAALAKEYSKDTVSAEDGGSIGENDETAGLVEPYKTAMLALEEGEISQVVESEFGYHIIKANKVLQPGEKSFEESKEQIVAQLEQQRVTDSYPGLREEVGVKWNSKFKLNEETGLPEPVLPESEDPAESADTPPSDDASAETDEDTGGGDGSDSKE